MRTLRVNSPLVHSCIDNISTRLIQAHFSAKWPTANVVFNMALPYRSSRNLRIKGLFIFTEFAYRIIGFGTEWLPGRCRYSRIILTDKFLEGILFLSLTKLTDAFYVKCFGTKFRLLDFGTAEAHDGRSCIPVNRVEARVPAHWTRRRYGWKCCKAYCRCIVAREGLTVTTNLPWNADQLWRCQKRFESLVNK